jgi:3-oxoacyl-[acyl-carrier protein] reductase
MDTGLSGRVALVTGGSQGIGKAIALALAREGALLAICARGEAALAQASQEIAQQTKTNVMIAKADCTDADQIKRMIAQVAAAFGHIDVLVNCVGRAKAGPFLELTDEDWEETINLKLMAAVRTTREVLPHMIRARWGRIIMIGGVFGIQPNPFSIPMGVVNAGLFNFCKALAQDVVRHNILVNAVAPGRIDTPLFAKLVDQQAAQSKLSREEALARILSEVPMGRAGSPSEIANAVTFLASELASYVSGEIMTVDGCWVKCL